MSLQRRLMLPAESDVETRPRSSPQPWSKPGKAAWAANSQRAAARMEMITCLRGNPSARAAIAAASNAGGFKSTRATLPAVVVIAPAGVDDRFHRDHRAPIASPRIAVAALRALVPVADHVEPARAGKRCALASGALASAGALGTGALGTGAYSSSALRRASSARLSWTGSRRSSQPALASRSFNATRSGSCARMREDA